MRSPILRWRGHNDPVPAAAGAVVCGCPIQEVIMRARRFWAALGSIALVAGVATPSSAVDTLPVPSTMAALGDSITVAYDATKLLTAQPEYSWSTGTSTSVQSVYLRLKKKNRKLVAANYAVSGARMSDLVGQAGKVPVGTAKGKELVTILMGANDACTDTVDLMTDPEVFRALSDAALGSSPPAMSTRSWSPPSRTSRICGRSGRRPRRRGWCGGSTGSANPCSRTRSPSRTLTSHDVPTSVTAWWRSTRVSTSASVR